MSKRSISPPTMNFFYPTMNEIFVEKYPHITQEIRGILIVHCQTPCIVDLKLWPTIMAKTTWKNKKVVSSELQAGHCQKTLTAHDEFAEQLSKDPNCSCRVCYLHWGIGIYIKTIQSHFNCFYYYHKKPLQLFLLL